MQTIAEVMTRDVQSISPQETVRRAAQMMDELNVGALPVCEGVIVQPASNMPDMRAGSRCFMATPVQGVKH